MFKTDKTAAPGPGRYAVEKMSIRASPSYTMGTKTSSEKKGPGAGPGPGQYSTEHNLGKSVRVSAFSKAPQRPKVDGGSGEIGPNAYNCVHPIGKPPILSTQRSMPLISFSKAAQRIDYGKTQNGRLPGPGNYRLPSSLSKRSCTLSGRTKIFF